MTTILVPTDFSSASDNALLFALDIASRNSSSVYLLNTYKLLQRAGVFIAIEQKMREDAQEQMQKLVSDVKKQIPVNVHVEGKVRKNMPVAGIKRFARRNEVDLIVMGTQGKSGWSEFLGSTTSGLINECLRPILAIPEKAKPNGFKRIVLAVDGLKYKRSNFLQPLKIIAELYQSSVQIVHVKQKSTPANITEQLPKELQEWSSSFLLLEQEKDINLAIHQYAESISADLICFIKRHRSFTGRFFNKSISRQEAHRSEIPLLILHDRL